MATRSTRQRAHLLQVSRLFRPEFLIEVEAMEASRRWSSADDRPAIYDCYCAFAQLTLGFHSPNMPLGFGRHPQMCSAHTLSGGPSGVNG